MPSLPDRSLPFIAAHCLLALALAIGVAPPLSAQETMAVAMANAIARMMESMGFPNTGVPSMIPALPNPTNPTSLPGWPSAFGALPLPQGMAAMTGASSALEGIWEDNQGGLLIVQGRFYRIHAPERGTIDGEIRVETDRIELSNQREQITQTFEFVLDQDRLVLRNHSGQLFLYRRLILDRGRSRPAN